MSSYNHIIPAGETLAVLIESIKPAVALMDEQYMVEVIQRFKELASRQESAAVLITNFNPQKPNLLRSQAETLQALLDFKRGLQVCGEMKESIKSVDQVREKINKSLGYYDND